MNANTDISFYRRSIAIITTCIFIAVASYFSHNVPPTLKAALIISAGIVFVGSLLATIFYRYDPGP